VSEEQLRAVVLKALAEVAPDAEADRIDPDASLADQLELDSIDLLNLVVSVHGQTGIDVPERDYPKLATLNAAVAYLFAAQSAGGASGGTGPLS